MPSPNQKSTRSKPTSGWSAKQNGSGLQQVVQTGNKLERTLPTNNRIFKLERLERERHDFKRIPKVHARNPTTADTAHTDLDFRQTRFGLCVNNCVNGRHCFRREDSHLEHG
jgi:hypothetical protein